MLSTIAERLLPGVRVMYRVALSSVAAGVVLASLGLTLTACSVSTKSVATGFSDTPSDTASIAAPKKRQPDSVALGGDPAAPREAVVTPASATKVAKLDQAPVGTFERAPKGVLADRDYTATALDAQRARELINQYRKEHGLKPVSLSAELTAAAKEHSRDLARWDRISHYGSDGSNPWDRVKRTGYKARVAAENVGTGQISFEEVLRGWKESPGHNKNLLLGDADNMGIALVQDPKTEFKSFWTLVLGSQI